jgi:hypothetical protein
MTSHSSIEDLVRLRFAVCLLGQKSGASWWGCDFLSDAGLVTLEYNFSRSPFGAGFEATCMAAKRLHDNRIGKTGVTHLFRLDPGLEVLLKQLKGSGLAGIHDSLGADQRALMKELARLGGMEIDSPEGPVQVGTIAEAGTERGIAQLARHYHAGFRLGLQVFPYFASKHG